MRRHPQPNRPSLLVALLLLCCSQVHGHGIMSFPNQRGALCASQSDFVFNDVNCDVPIDWAMHFPAGDKSGSGAGQRSQRDAAGSRGWTPFEPLSPSFRWRSGVCGDLPASGIDNQPHLHGGEYASGIVVATYQEGGVVDVTLSVVGHHNGFMQMQICDLDKCPGAGHDVSTACFRTPGACHVLKRKANSECDSGTSKLCGPIDKKYPERWYLPCAKHPGVNIVETFGPGTALFELPTGFHAERAVLQWYWAAANQCNPPGLEAYFEGEDRPTNWGSCPGDSGSKGGYASHLSTCGGDRFAEEYIQCADVVVTPRAGGGRGGTSVPSTTTATTTRTTTTRRTTRRSTRRRPSGSRRCVFYDASAGRAAGYGGVRDLVLVGGRCRRYSLYKTAVYRRGEFSEMRVEALTAESVREVQFWVDGVDVGVVSSKPFLIRLPSHVLVPGRVVKVTARADGDTDSVTFVVA